MNLGVSKQYTDWRLLSVRTALENDGIRQDKILNEGEITWADKASNISWDLFSHNVKSPLAERESASLERFLQACASELLLPVEHQGVAKNNPLRRTQPLLNRPLVVSSCASNPCCRTIPIAVGQIERERERELS